MSTETTKVPTRTTPERLHEESPVEESERVSPEWVRLSMAAAMELGLEPGKMLRGCGCGCINLLQTYAVVCYANCSYCGLARERPGAAEARKPHRPTRQSNGAPADRPGGPAAPQARRPHRPPRQAGTRPASQVGLAKPKA